MILYIENPKDPTKKLSELSKVAGYKITMHKPVVFLHTSNKQSKDEI